jgi:hypothetical protein
LHLGTLEIAKSQNKRQALAVGIGSTRPQMFGTMNHASISRRARRGGYADRMKAKHVGYVGGSEMEDKEKKPEQPAADYAFFRGGKKLGTLTIGESWFPWYQGEFHPTPEFEEVRPLFDELFLMPTSDAFEETWAKVNEPGVCVKSLHDETTFDTFILHIRKDRFRLRILKFD